MEQKIKEASALMLKVLRNRSLDDPLCRQELAKLLILYREIWIQGEVGRLDG